MRVTNILLIIASIAFLFTACNDVTDSSSVENDSWLQETRAKGNAMGGPNGSDNSIFSIAAESEDFTTLAAAVEFAGLKDALNGNRQFTVFAPTNDAFEALAEELGLESATDLLVDENKELVKNVLLYHVAPGARDAEDVTESDQINTLLKKFIDVEEEESAYLVGNEENGYAQIFATDIFASNGVVHGIDSVMLPPTGKNAGDDEDGDDSDDEEEKVEESILEIASTTENFSTLAAAVTFADLGDALDGKKQYTVFAPTNAAFDALLSELGLTAEQLLVEENRELVTNILLYHVAPGSRDSEEVTESDKVNTLLEKFITVQEDGGEFFVGNDENGFAKITTTDIFASNGVIHVIDAVLLPPSDKNNGDDDDDDDSDD